ncbi:MAG: restriction endonuclease [Sulfolobales archaeon]|nr:restriction endonuclease [Sulfolobales archaeon]MCX8208138.1 restriction endonuclease [Sulfolobales archaeon]MDW8010287.1 restriction endonuclease [Sulfolobales archaeon]
MQPTDYYSLLRLFSDKRCVKEEELDSAVVRELSDLDLAYRGVSGEFCVKSIAQLAIAAVKRGSDPKKVSAYLSWRDFELFVAEALEESGYEVYRNFKFGTKKWELDVVAANVPASLGVAVDCKHWSPKYFSINKIREVAYTHLEKLRKLLEWCGYDLMNYPTLRRVSEFIGFVVTLSESTRGSIEGVGVVPIYYFKDFVGNIRYYIEELKIVALRNPCYVSS